jgi:hypothetical protein
MAGFWEGIYQNRISFASGTLSDVRIGPMNSDRNMDTGRAGAVFARLPVCAGNISSHFCEENNDDYLFHIEL